MDPGRCTRCGSSSRLPLDDAGDGGAVEAAGPAGEAGGPRQRQFVRRRAHTDAEPGDPAGRGGGFRRSAALVRGEDRNQVSTSPNSTLLTLSASEEIAGSLAIT